MKNKSKKGTENKKDLNKHVPVFCNSNNKIQTRNININLKGY